MSLFGNIFDFNGDGKVDGFEQAAEFATFAHMMDTLTEEEQEESELEVAGLDAEELEFMDADERREVLEDAGLDPDDYDF